MKSSAIAYFGPSQLRNEECELEEEELDEFNDKVALSQKTFQLVIP